MKTEPFANLGPGEIPPSEIINPIERREKTNTPWPCPACGGKTGFTMEEYEAWQKRQG